MLAGRRLPQAVWAVIHMGDQVRTDQEIVQDILHEVRTAGAEAPEAGVRGLIEGLRALKLYGPLSGNRSSNRKYARKLVVWIDGGKQLLAEHPENFNLNLLFAPEPAAGDHIEAVYQKAELRYGWFAALLADMRSRCDWIIEHKYGEHGSAGYQQERSAIASREVMDQLKLPLAYSSPTSAYRRVASLFFEAMTGTYDADLERACEAMAASKLVTGTEI
jgi:hypothetical protein